VTTGCTSHSSMWAGVATIGVIPGVLWGWSGGLWGHLGDFWRGGAPGGLLGGVLEGVPKHGLGAPERSPITQKWDKVPLQIRRSPPPPGLNQPLIRRPQTTIPGPPEPPGAPQATPPPDPTFLGFGAEQAVASALIFFYLLFICFIFYKKIKY